MTTANVVFSGPASEVRPITREAQVAAGQTILPGMLVELTAGGEWQVQSTAGAGGDIYIADMDVIRQKDVTEALTAGDNHKAFVPEVGRTYNLILTDGENVAKGALLAAAGDGKVVEATSGTATPDVALFAAEEALAPSGADGRIRARYIGSAQKASA